MIAHSARLATVSQESSHEGHPTGDLCPVHHHQQLDQWSLCLNHVPDQSEQRARHLKMLANIPPDDGLNESKSYFSFC